MTPDRIVTIVLPCLLSTGITLANAPVDVQSVLNQWAPEAGRYQSFAEPCLERAAPEAKSDFIAAAKKRFPADVGQLEDAYDRAYAEMRADLAQKKKQKCRQKRFNRLAQTYEQQVSVLMPANQDMLLARLDHAGEMRKQTAQDLQKKSPDLCLTQLPKLRRRYESAVSRCPGC